MSNNINILIKDYKLVDEGYLGACDAVSQTLGAEGKYALLDSGSSEPPILTKDGVSVALRIRYENPTKNFGALQAIQGAVSTLKKSGDSTTTTMVFQKSYLSNLDRSVFNKAVERGIKKAVSEVYGHLEDLKIETDETALRMIANTSCNNDLDLGAKIVQAFSVVGYDGVVEVSKNENSEDIRVIEQSGMILPNQGYSSPFFINKESKPVFEDEDVHVLCLAVWQENTEILDFLKLFVQKNGNKAPLLIFTERPITEFKDRLITIKNAGINVCLVGLAVQSEYENVSLLNDIAMFTGAEVYSNGNPTFVTGLASKAVVSDTQTILSVGEIPKAVTDAVEVLKSKEVVTRSDTERLKRLSGKSCLVEVGGLTPNDIREKFDRVEDALASVKSAISEGYVPGGGSVLTYISNKLETSLDNKDEQLGYNLVKTVLHEPMIQILKNSNREEVKDKYLAVSKQEFGVGYNALKDDKSNLLADGIIDSKKSIRVALESATESAIKMFNLGVIVHYPKI